MGGRREWLGVVVSAVLSLFVVAKPARAQDPSVSPGAPEPAFGGGGVSEAGPAMSLTYRAIFHGYKLRLFPDPNSGGRRPGYRTVDPLSMTLDLGAWGLGSSGGLDVIGSIRYRTDFGSGFHRDTPPDVLQPPTTDGQNQLDVLLLYVDWHDVASGLDLRFGRQIILDDLDWYPVDGLRASFRLVDTASTRLILEGYVGMPVKLDWLASSDALLADGYEVNDGPGFVFGGAAMLRLLDDLQLSAAYRQEVVFRGKELTIFRPTATSDAETKEISATQDASSGKYALEQMVIGAGVGYTLRPIDLDLYAHGIWNLIFGKADLARVGLGYNPAIFLHLGAEYVRSWPRFGADSIFNVFNIFPNSRGRLEADLEILRGLRVQAGYFAILVEGEPRDTLAGTRTEYTGSNVSHGPSGGVVFRTRALGLSSIGGGVTGEVATNTNGRYAFGGNYRRIEAFGETSFLEDRIGAVLRAGTLTVQNDWFERADANQVVAPTTSYTIELGGRARLLDWALVRLNLIKNFGSYLEGSFRVFTMLEVRY